MPTHDIEIDQLIAEDWPVFQYVMDKADLAFPRRSGQLREETRQYGDDEIWEAIQRSRQQASEETKSEEPPDLKEAEWTVFTRLPPEVNADDFRLRPVDVPAAYTGVIDRVVLVERLREVRAIAGFTRLDSPGEFSELGDDDTIEKIAPISRRPPTWVPAVEVRGEGVFIQFNEAKIEEWRGRESVIVQSDAFFGAHVH